MNSNNKQKRKSRRSQVIPPSFGCPCFELSGNRELLIEGSRGVLEYSSDIIRVNTLQMIVSVSGHGLNLKCISDSALMIDGFITCLEFTQ